LASDIPETIDKDNSPPLFSFLFRLFTDNKNTVGKFISRKRPPYLYLFIWLLGMSLILSIIESAPYLYGHGPHNWLIVWCCIILVGAIGGFPAFILGGAVYHLLIKLSGGSGDFRLSRHILLYSGLLLYLVLIAGKIFETVANGNAYSDGLYGITVNVLWGILIIAAFIWTIIFSYRAARQLHHIRPVRGSVLLIALPLLLHIAGPVGIIFNSTANYNEGIDYNNRALEYFYNGEYEEAEKYYHLALSKINKKYPEDLIAIHENLGLLHETRGLNDSAVIEYQKGLAYCDSMQSGYFSIKGKISILNGKIFAAIDNFDRALILDSNNYDAHNNLGLIFMGEYDENLFDYVRALYHNRRAYAIDNNFVSMQNLAINYFVLEEYANSFSLFNSLNKIEPDNPATKYFLGIINYLNGRIEEAKLKLNEAVRLDSSYYNADVEAILND